MSDYDEYEYHDYYRDDDRLCYYCGDRPAQRRSKYCGGYCEYRDTVIVPMKKARFQYMIENNITIEDIINKAQKKEDTTKEAGLPMGASTGEQSELPPEAFVLSPTPTLEITQPETKETDETILQS